MILSVLFFISISVTIVLGLANPMIRHISMATSISVSKESFYVAEAGIEDVLYRLKAGLPVPSSNSLTIGDHSATITVTDEMGGKTIVSTGDADNYFRKIETKLATGDGASFHYGLQTGTGGIFMDNNAAVFGNVYANGDIIGGNGSRIDGTAYAANVAALTTDQANESPLPPGDEIQFGHNSTSEDIAQSFVVSESLPVNKVSLYIRKTGTPANLTLRIVSDNSGSPSTNVLAQGVLSASLVTATFGWVDVPLSSNPELEVGDIYWVVLDGGNNSSRYYIVGANSAYGSGNAKVGRYGSTWNNTSPFGLDAYFKIFLGGLSSTIDGVIVGSGGVGDARAHTVTNSNVAGNIYCQVGSGNNKPCNSSLPDPSPEPFPISDGNVDEWKAAAESGGTGSSVTLSGTSSSLGPRKINGNLTLTNNAIVTLTGTIWVTGNINVSNGAIVRLSAGYGPDSGVIVTDGEVDISNNADFRGSGQSSSYILLLTTSGSSNAVDVSNNAGTVILNAQKGSINFANNAGAKSATAKQINMSNGATIRYESGLININFSSGPSGGYNILNWKEVE